MYTIWIDLGDGLRHYEQEPTLAAAFEVGIAMQAVDIMCEGKQYTRVGEVWEVREVVTIHVG